MANTGAGCGSPIQCKKNAAHPGKDGGARKADLMWDPDDLGITPIRQGQAVPVRMQTPRRQRQSSGKRAQAEIKQSQAGAN
jgi:hypothetical protein